MNNVVTMYIVSRSLSSRICISLGQILRCVCYKILLNGYPKWLYHHCTFPSAMFENSSLHIFINTQYRHILCFSHFNEYIMLPYCCINLYFLGDTVLNIFMCSLAIFLDDFKILVLLILSIYSLTGSAITISIYSFKSENG